jgi:hypothetical protein
MRGGDLLCEAETFCGYPSSGQQVEDAANWPKTGHLANVGLDWGSLVLLVLILSLDIVNLGLHVVNVVGFPCV